MKIEKIGWIGTGVMGEAMCLNLLKAGPAINVHNRTKDKAQVLLDRGATWFDKPADVSRHSQLTFTIVGYPQDVNSLYLAETGILSAAKPGSILVDMTTSEPSLAQKIFKMAGEKNVEGLDAPVSGGDIGAREGKLAIMVGGNKEAFDKVLPYFKLMGENIALMGPAGSGQHTKMSNQILIASTMIGTVESLLYASKAGLDRDELINIIGKGAAASWSINNLGRRIVKENFDPGFFIKHFVKDMGIALKEAEKMRISLPGLGLAHQFYLSAMANDLANHGTQALYKVFEKMNNITQSEIIEKKGSKK